MAEVGNAAATGGVLVAPGGASGAAERTDGGGQKTTNGGGGPSTVGNKEKPEQRGLAYHGSPETLADGTQVQHATNAQGNAIREERTTDGRMHTTETTPAGEVVSESWVDPDGTGKTVETHSDTNSTTTRTFSDGHKEVTDSSPEGQHTQIYDSSGRNVVRTVSSYPDGRTSSTDTASGQRSEWGKPVPRPPAGGGMSQVDMGDMEPGPAAGNTRPNPNEQSI